MRRLGYLGIILALAIPLLASAEIVYVPIIVRQSTATATVTPTVVVIPTIEVPNGQCVDIMQNGNFEARSFWGPGNVILDGMAPPMCHSGDACVQLAVGNWEGPSGSYWNKYVESISYMIPSDATNVLLTYWFKLSATNNLAPGTYRVYADRGAGIEIIEADDWSVLLGSSLYKPYEQHSVNLTDYHGTAVLFRFELRTAAIPANLIPPGYSSQMKGYTVHLDDVSLVVCR